MGLILLLLNLLMIVTIGHWLLGFLLRSSYNSSVERIYLALDQIMAPMLSGIRGFIKPVRMADGREMDLAHIVVIIGIWIVKSFLR